MYVSRILGWDCITLADKLFIEGFLRDLKERKQDFKIQMVQKYFGGPFTLKPKLDC